MEKEYQSKMQNDTKYILKILNENAFNQKLVKQYQKRFLMKYKDYYKSGGFIQKYNRLKMYLNDREKFNKNKIIKNKTGLSYLEKIDLGYNILQTNICDYQKVYEIVKYFKNSEVLLNKIYDFLIPYMDNNYIKKAIELYLFLNKYDDVIEKIKIDYEYIEEQQMLKKNYLYAKFIINEYINDPLSYRLSYFLDKFGIDSETFLFCIETIKNLDYDLFDKYSNKYEKDKEQRFNTLLYTMKNIINGIKTGYLFDGTEFNELEFWRIIPFINRDYGNNELDDLKEIDCKVTRHNSFTERVRDFTLHFLPNDHHYICEYLRDNKIQERSILYFDDNIYTNVNIVINDRIVTKNDITLVINYIKNNNLPRIRRVLAIILRKYFDNEIDIYSKNENKMNEKILLIP